MSGGWWHSLARGDGRWVVDFVSLVVLVDGIKPLCVLDPGFSKFRKRNSAFYKRAFFHVPEYAQATAWHTQPHEKTLSASALRVSYFLRSHRDSNPGPSA